MAGVVNGYYYFAIWVSRFAYLNILWILFTILGLGIFGFMPATVAMFSVVRKWNMGERDVAIFSLFWQSYRQEFVKANGLGMILVGIGYLLSIEFQILSTQNSLLYVIVRLSVLVIAFLYIILLLYFFPIFVHFNLKPLHYLKWPFIIGMIHPILTIFLMVSLGILHYLTFTTIPALLFFFGGSVTAFILMWGASQTFSKYEASW